MSGDLNGAKDWLSRDEWLEHRDEVRSTAQKIDEIHQKIPVFIEHTSHLSKLDYLKDIKESLLSAAVGKDHIPMKIAMRMFTVLGFVVMGLMFLVVFLLTGESLGWIAPLNH